MRWLLVFCILVTLALLRLFQSPSDTLEILTSNVTIPTNYSSNFDTTIDAFELFAECTASNEYPEACTQYIQQCNSSLITCLNGTIFNTSKCLTQHESPNTTFQIVDRTINFNAHPVKITTRSENNTSLNIVLNGEISFNIPQHNTQNIVLEHLPFLRWVFIFEVNGKHCFISNYSYSDSRQRLVVALGHPMYIQKAFIY